MPFTPREKIFLLVIKKSHKLLLHYSNLLNMHDGGKRKIPKSYHRWIARIREVEERRVNEAEKI